MAKDAAQTTGVVLLVLGVLMLLGWLRLPGTHLLAAVALLAAGTLILVEQVKGPKALGAALVVLGLLVIIPNPVGGWLLEMTAPFLPVLVGALTVVLGVFLIAR